MSAARWVLHIDLDQFIAAVELLRRPELRGKPVVVAVGDPQGRGVVATATYEARAFGVSSGMPLRTAARRCPQAIFLPHDRAAYEEASSRVMDVLRRFPGVLEVAGWDEAFLEVHAQDPEAVAREIRRAVAEATSLSCSVGVGRTKLQAKLASGLAKPGGVFRLTEENWPQVMEGRPPRALWGIGPKTEARLAKAGIRTVGDLARADDATLSRLFGPHAGPWLRAVARGEADWPVSAERPPARGRGRETTFQRNLKDPAAVADEVRRIARQLAADVAAEGRAAVRVVVKVRYAPFTTRTHGVRLRPPTTDAQAIEAAAVEALSAFELDCPVRLVGVRAELAPPGAIGEPGPEAIGEPGPGGSSEPAPQALREPPGG